MEEKIQKLLLEIGEAIAGGLPIAEEIAQQLRKDFEQKYNEVGKPFGDSLEGLYQYILGVKIEIGED